MRMVLVRQSAVFGNLLFRLIDNHDVICSLFAAEIQFVRSQPSSAAEAAAPPMQ